ncbi:hypothetical protein BHM03_00028425 [Ensete ventricosum]|nr:hypothetical protein BHM03_00028425 [Ensete ventricosum]
MLRGVRLVVKKGCVFVADFMEGKISRGSITLRTCKGRSGGKTWEHVTVKQTGEPHATSNGTRDRRDSCDPRRRRADPPSPPSSRGGAAASPPSALCRETEGKPMHVLRALTRVAGGCTDGARTVCCESHKESRREEDRAHERRRSTADRRPEAHHTVILVVLRAFSWGRRA